MLSAGPTPHTLKMLEFTTRVLWDAGRTVAGQDVQLTGFVLTQRPDGFVLAISRAKAAKVQ